MDGLIELSAALQTMHMFRLNLSSPSRWNSVNSGLAERDHLANRLPFSPEPFAAQATTLKHALPLFR